MKIIQPKLWQLELASLQIRFEYSFCFKMHCLWGYKFSSPVLLALQFKVAFKVFFLRCETIYFFQAEVREAIVSNMANNQKEAVFQNSNAGETSCKLLTTQNVMEDPSCSHRKDSNPVVISAWNWQEQYTLKEIMFVCLLIYLH